MDVSTSALDADDRANALYWGSDMSVNQIADALDLSKGALYEMIRPLATAIPCPSCGAETVHPNRTAKERGLVACPECGWGGEGAPPPPASLARTPAKIAPPQTPSRERSLPAATPASGRRGLSRNTLAAGILVGAVAGIAVYLWSRRRT
jgi:predicted RNA-binding Zn-ribbon protein involved in translation (DUF1610 family)